MGSEEPWFEPLEGYTAIGKISTDDLVIGLQGPEKKEDAEVCLLKSFLKWYLTSNYFR